MVTSTQSSIAAFDPDHAMGDKGVRPNPSVSLPPRAPQKRQPKKKGPNYNHIHKDPLPLQTHPLPAFHPSNPLSLLRVAYIYLSQLLSPPSSRLSEGCVGYFSPETRSVHITDPKHIRALWEMGFFGKGLLSRSEPSWLDREKARIKAERGGGGTAEEATGRRREERRLFKLERARLEAERIKRQRAVEEGGDGPQTSHLEDEPQNTAANNDSLSAAKAIPNSDPAAIPEAKSGTGRIPDAEIVSSAAPKVSAQLTSVEAHMDEAMPDDDSAAVEVDITNHEHLQLSLEEAFFLRYSLGALDIHANTPMPTMSPQAYELSTANLLLLFSNYSTFPPTPADSILPPDAPFLLHYVVYHHFRSLGWVVRPGTKFSVDYLLYNRGPVFSHAEFAILIMPAYTDPYWDTSLGLAARKCDDAKSWSWLHCINRVQSQVRKTLVLCYVDIPPPRQEMNVTHGASQDARRSIDIGRLLKRYKVREFVVRRWVANRSRD
nr:putative trna-splicing endonuclease subunit sen2 [Quercus suber]